MTVALLCSGQGHLDRRMLDKLSAHAAARPILAAAEEVLGTGALPFLSQCAEEQLHANRHSQILMVTRGLAAAAVLADPLRPSETIIAGYSVGEVAAWGAAGVWSPIDTLRLTDARARLMDLAGGDGGGLGYVRGLSRDAVDKLCRRFDCAVAIINPDLLFVVGGDRHNVIDLCEAALAQGASRAKPMNVRVASHTPFLKGAVAPFERALAQVPSRRPTFRLLSASDQRLVTDPVKARSGIARQIATPIDWTATLESLAERGVRLILELGPASALADMARAYSPEWQARSLDDFASVAGARSWLCGA